MPAGPPAPLEPQLTGEPFDPTGVSWTSVSPRLATARRLVLGVVMLLIAVVFAAVPLLAGLPALAGFAAVPLALLAWGWWVIGRQVRAYGYAERDEDLLVRHGVMWRELVVVPYGRLQYVDVEAGPVARALGIATVQLHTAAAATDAVIPGLPPQEAGRLRDRLASRGQARLAGL